MAQQDPIPPTFAQREKPAYPRIARLSFAVLSSLAQLMLLVAIGLWVLPNYGISVPWPIIAAICVLFLAWDIFTYIMGTRALERGPVRGLASMIGQTGVAATDLNPKGHVRLRGELWAAHSTGGQIERGAPVEVVEQYGLRLKVRPGPR